MPLLIAAFLPVQIPGTPARDTGPAGPATYVIRGRLLDAVSGLPITGAEVSARLNGRADRAERAALTDAEGRWQITGLAAGDYMLMHGKRGYNRVRGVRTYSPVHVSAEHPVRDIELVLMRGGVIAGRVFDQLGEPAPGVHVSALRVHNDEAWPGGQDDSTDDRGEFRLYGLEPGDYVVSAAPQMAQVVEAADGTQRSQVATYYPGTPRVTEAERLTLGEQSEIGDLSFQLQTAATVTVSGRIVTSGGSLRHAYVQVHEDGSHPMVVRGRVPGGRSISDGQFAIRGVLPGAYVVTARATLDKGEEVGQIAIVVGDEDVDVVLQTHGPLVLTGRVVSVSGGVLPFRRLRVAAIPMEPTRFGMGGGDAPVQEDGAFRVETFASPVRLQVMAPGDPLGWRVREVRWNGNPVTRSGVDVGSTSGAATGIEVVVVGRTARLQGTVQATDGTPLADGTVVIVPEEPDEGPPFAFRAVITAGRFVSLPLAPGRYLVAAVSAIDQSVMEEQTLDRVRFEGLTIELGDRETRNLDLKVMR